MNAPTLSRRHCLAALGAAAALAPIAAKAAPPPAMVSTTPRSETAEPGVLLVSPLQPGSVLGEWRVEQISGVVAGAISITMRGSANERFYLDICRRDSSAGAPQPPAQSALCDVFVANEGNGSSQTWENHGLAAMAVAEIIRANERQIDLGALLTLRDRLTHHRNEIVRGS